MNIILSLQKNILHSLRSCIEKNINRILLLLIGLTILINAQSQADKRLVLADKYFAAGDYFTAAGLYEQFLNPDAKQKMPTGFPLNSKKNSQGKTGKQVNECDILYKQAESYRLSNYWLQASAGYKKCFEKDSVKFASALYWYAVCQRNITNYRTAEESITLFLNTYAAGNPYQQAAKQELETLQFIKSQSARPDTILYHIQKINAYEKEKGIFAPVAIKGNQFMITSTQADSVVKAGINPFHNRLFYTTLTDGNLQNTEPVNIDSIDASLNQGAASISANGNHLYFTQWKKEKGQTISAVYYSTKKENGWSEPVLLTSVNQQGYNSKQPFCTADGKYLFFASDRYGGYGNFDIWYAPLQTDGTAGEPVNAGAALNTTGNEQAPFYHSSSNTLVFSSDRTPGTGGYDLYTSKGWETEWKTPENMGHPVNSSRDDLYFFAPEKETLPNKAIFSSDRGSECCLETYAISKSSKRKMITGVIQDCRNNEPVDGANVIMKDASGKSITTTTGNDGTYHFELTSDVNQQQLFISKELYKEKTTGITVA